MALRQLNLKESSNVKSAYFDTERGEIVIEFKSGSRGRYTGTSAEEADAFERAESPGKYVHQFLKTRFPFAGY